MTNKQDELIINKYERIKVSATFLYAQKFSELRKAEKEQASSTKEAFFSSFYDFLVRLRFKEITMADINDFLSSTSDLTSLRQLIAAAKNQKIENKNLHSVITDWLYINLYIEEAAYIELSAASQSDFSYSERRLNEELTLAIKLKDMEAVSLFAELINDNQIPALEWNSSDDGSKQELYVHDAMYHLPSRINSIIYNKDSMTDPSITKEQANECFNEVYNNLEDYDGMFDKSDEIVSEEVSKLLKEYKKQRAEEHDNNGSI